MRSFRQPALIAALFLQLLPVFADDVITNIMSPIVSYQYSEDYSSQVLTNGGVQSPLVSFQYLEDFSRGALTNGGIISIVVSYQYLENFSAAALTNGGIMSPIVSYQYYEWPGNGILNLLSSPVLSYYYGSGVLPAAVTVRGQVLDAGTGQPLAGALIQLGANSTASDAQGDYSFASVMTGQYPLMASKAGYVDANETIFVAPGSSPTRVLSLQPASAPGSAPRVRGITSKYRFC